MGGMLMDYMREIKEISAEQAIILWQASRLSLSKIYEKAPEILKVQGSVIGTLGNFSASIGKNDVSFDIHNWVCLKFYTQIYTQKLK